MNKQDFIQKLRAKYPMYSGIDDNTLFTKVTTKYPQYLEQIEEEKQPGLIDSTINQAKTIGQGIGEGAYKFGADISKIKQGVFQKEAAGGQPTDTGIEKGFLGKTISSGINRQNIFAQRKQSQGDIGQTRVEKGLDKVGQGFGLVGDVVGQGVASIASTVTDDKQKEAFKTVVSSVGQSKVGQATGKQIGVAKEAFNMFEKQSPRLASQFRNIGNASEVLADVYGGGVAKGGVQNTGKVLGNVADTVGDFSTQASKKVINKVGDTTRFVGTKSNILKDKVVKKVVNTPKQNYEKGRELLYEAVNPTKLENKKVLAKRVDDLIPYINTKNPLKNDLPDVYTRIEKDRAKALISMKKYETNTGVKGVIDTDSIAQSLAEKFQKKIGKSYLDPEEARMADDLIDILKGFGKQVRDADIIAVRRAWDKIEKKNKGFMMSSESTAKGDVFGVANRFFREEIKKSNPGYAKYLEKYHKTTTIGDIVQATIDRRVGQQGGGFIRRGFEVGTRVTGAGLGGLPGYLGSEALIQGAKLMASPSVRLTRGARKVKGSKILTTNKTKNALDNSGSNKPNNNSISGKSNIRKSEGKVQKQVIKKPVEKTTTKKPLIKNTTPKSDTRKITKTKSVRIKNITKNIDKKFLKETNPLSKKDVIETPMGDILKESSKIKISTIEGKKIIEDIRKGVKDSDEFIDFLGANGPLRDDIRKQVIDMIPVKNQEGWHGGVEKMFAKLGTIAPGMVDATKKYKTLDEFYKNRFSIKGEPGELEKLQSIVGSLDDISEKVFMKRIWNLVKGKTDDYIKSKTDILIEQKGEIGIEDLPF